MIERFRGMPVQTKARLAGWFYAGNTVTSLTAFMGFAPPAVADLMGHLAAVCYLAVTALLYEIFKPAGRTLSALAAWCSVLGCLTGELHSLHVKTPLHALVWFGCYCSLIGYLTVRSRLMPRVVGWLMMLAGAGWLTFVSPDLAKAALPVPYITAMVGEWLLMFWLLLKGVNLERWRELGGQSE
jgi:hypothetical protein